MSPGILDFLMSRSAAKDGALIVSFSACREAASKYGVTAREAELLALENGICPSRYERNIGTFGMQGQAALLRSRAAVAGCGGLGGWISELLARAGVGELILFDGDSFEESNLNRQLMATEENLGTAKVLAAAARVNAVNGAISVVPHNVRLAADNAEELLGGCDIVVDALDNNRSRRDVFKVCCGLGIPFVHGAIGGFFGQIGVFYPGEIPFWMEDSVPDKGMELETGNPPFTPSFIASLQAAETVKILAGLDDRLKETMLWFDIKRYDIQNIKTGRAD